MDVVLVTLHLLAACVWVGGSVVVVFVCVPLARERTGRERAEALRFVGARWRPLGWGALLLLGVTGLALAAHDGGLSGAASTAFHVVLGVKALLVAGLLLAVWLHDHRIGPALARQIREGRPQTLRPLLVRIGWANLALTIAVPVLGVALGRLH